MSAADPLDLDTLLREADGAHPTGRPVLSQTGTALPNPRAYAPSPEPQRAAVNPDTLFASSKSYWVIKKEKPEHRLILWYRLQGYNQKETAALTGYTVAWVSQICNQPWFTEAFCKLSAEVGKDAVQTFLEGEVLPALQRTAELADSAESEAVRLAANREILDRFLGKSVAKAEVKSSGTLDVNVTDITEMQKEIRRNAEILAARGISLPGAN